MKILLLILVIPCLVLGYGYWHASTHGSVYITLYFEKSIDQKHELLSKAELSFIDINGQILAKGISDKTYNFVHLIHPKLGDCHESTLGWLPCYKQVVTWIPRWVNQVTQVQIRHSDCKTDNLPITITKNNGEWLYWWVPLPHVGGKPTTYYSSTIRLKPSNCI